MHSPCMPAHRLFIADIVLAEKATLIYEGAEFTFRRCVAGQSVLPTDYNTHNAHKMFKASFCQLKDITFQINFE